MKPNEAPERIYVVDATFPDYVDFDGSPINTKRIDGHDIEYTRTDAFIERACEWLHTMMQTHAVVELLSGEHYEKELIKDFRKYMRR